MVSASSLVRRPSDQLAALVWRAQKVLERSRGRNWLFGLLGSRDAVSPCCSFPDGPERTSTAGIGRYKERGMREDEEMC